jgi:hypothetical protein
MPLATLPVEAGLQRALLWLAARVRCSTTIRCTVPKHSTSPCDCMRTSEFGKSRGTQCCSLSACQWYWGADRSKAARPVQRGTGKQLRGTATALAGTNTIVVGEFTSAIPARPPATASGVSFQLHCNCRRSSSSTSAAWGGGAPGRRNAAMRRYQYCCAQ